MKAILTVLKDLYGAGILFFYYVKWFVAIGVPILYFQLDYKRNYILDILWVWCIILIIKDFIYTFVLKKSYCDGDNCSTKKKDK
jgi:hypothetical protein